MRKPKACPDIVRPGQGIFSIVRNALHELVDIVYPATCLICKTRLKGKPAVDTVICMHCWKRINKNVPPFCSRCGRHLEKRDLAKNICPRCIRSSLHFDRAFSACNYEGVTKELIHAFKYKGKQHLGLTLSRLMSQFIDEYNVPIDFVDAIVPVPLHNSRLREREFNQAHLLSRHIGERYKKEVASSVLIRHRPTPPQAELEEHRRLMNVKGSFSVSRDASVQGKTILLIDDVLTTGATCSEAAYALKSSGAHIVFVMTLAH